MLGHTFIKSNKFLSSNKSIISSISLDLPFDNIVGHSFISSNKSFSLNVFIISSILSLFPFLYNVDNLLDKKRSISSSEIKLSLNTFFSSSFVIITAPK